MENKYTWLMTWGNVLSETPKGRVLPGNNSYGQVPGALGRCEVPRPVRRGQEWDQLYSNTWIGFPWKGVALFLEKEQLRKVTDKYQRTLKIINRHVLPSICQLLG